MKTLDQLSFEFHILERSRESHHRASWQVRHIARRYRLNVTHAAVYNDLMGLPAREVPHG